MATQYEGVAFGKVDVDENADAAVDFEISAVRFPREKVRVEIEGYLLV